MTKIGAFSAWVLKFRKYLGAKLPRSPLEHIGYPANIIKDGSRLSWSPIEARCSSSSFFCSYLRLAARKAINRAIDI